MSISSHITIPRVVLRQFLSDEREHFYFIDFFCTPSNLIKRGRVKSFNTKKDYYTAEVEEFLNKNVETHINKLLSKAPDISDEELVLDETAKNQAFLYLETLLSRDSEFHKEQKETPSEIVMVMTRLLKETGIIRDKYNVSYLINNSNIPFTLPSNGIIQINKTNIICPISPRVALLFFESEENYFKVVDEDSLMMEINRFAFKQALKNKCKALICDSKNFLEKLKKDCLNS